MNQPAIVLDRVTKQFGQFRAVDDLSFEVPRGSIYGFLGPNGAGKTTTIRMILSIFEPTSGRLQVLGRRSALEVRDRIGYLPEEKGLYKSMKAWAVIAYFGMLKGLPKKVAKHRAHELLERYGLGEWQHRKCQALSKGMQQKVQLLCSIVHEPELVILDEPFVGLDPVNQDVMEGAIRDIRRRGGTVIFSTHVMEHAERLCEKILLIADGRKIFDGSIAESKGMIPRRVRIETHVKPSALSRVKGVLSLEPVGGSGVYDVVLSDGANPEDILKACFRLKIPLKRFDRSEASLRDVFVHLVGANRTQKEQR